MKKARNVWSIIYPIIIVLFAHQAGAADWIFISSTPTRDVYYDQSSVKRVKKKIVRVWAKAVFNKDSKMQTFSFLESMNKAPDDPDILSHALGLHEIDCVEEKIRDISTIIYDEENRVLYSSPKGERGKWNDILADSVGEILKNIVCKGQNSAEKAVAAASTATDKNLAGVPLTQDDPKSIGEGAVRNLVTKWLDSWKSGDMETYRSCYAPDFKSKRMNLDAWVAHKAKINQKSKNIAISIDKLQISEKGNSAAAVFIQSYSSSLFAYYSGKKKLELKKINGEWKIYSEIMH